MSDHEKWVGCEESPGEAELHGRQNLSEIRRKIDETDSRILELFCHRMDLVRSVADYKMRNQLPVLRPEREQEIIAQVRNTAGEDYADYAEDLFRHLMRISREMQSVLISGVAAGAPADR